MAMIELRKEVETAAPGRVKPGKCKISVICFHP